MTVESSHAAASVETPENTVSSLPASVEPDDEAMEQKILTAKAAYDGLTAHGKSLVDQKTVWSIDKDHSL